MELEVVTEEIVRFFREVVERVRIFDGAKGRGTALFVAGGYGALGPLEVADIGW